MPPAVRTGTAGGFRRFGGGAGAILRWVVVDLVCNADDEEEDSPETGESGRSPGDVGETMQICGVVPESTGSCVSATVSGRTWCRRSCVDNDAKVDVVASTSTEPVRSRRLPPEDVLAVAAATRGRLVALSLLDCRRPSMCPDRPLGCCNVPRGLDEPTISRFSALRLAFACLPRTDPGRSRCGGAAWALLSGAEETERPGLLTRRPKSSDPLSWRTGPRFDLRNWTHHSPERQRVTRRLVVGSTSRMDSFSTSNSSTRTICARLYGIERSWVFVRRG